jgi:hypothetical protein
MDFSGREECSSGIPLVLVCMPPLVQHNLN